MRLPLPIKCSPLFPRDYFDGEVMSPALERLKIDRMSPLLVGSRDGNRRKAELVDRELADDVPK